ncbi:DUF2382 domain-containing protein [Kamptonema formosum]|uniref:DUF2382 domain-containing protein n=1 Tax=Kamptonema formosum TaxID=331992 RepID=UPI000347E922|nr:DUF2382 domain-containing protein [Oscillatoria sp. PCC 10802]
MALLKIADYYPNYQEEILGDRDIKGMDVYAGSTDEKIGTVYDILVDDTGRFRYLVIDTGFWIFGKKVLLPVGSSRIDYQARRVYATDLTSKQQAESLPEYREDMTVDYDYEERVRGVYRTPTAAGTATGAGTYDSNTYSYDRDAALYQMNEQEHQPLTLYEERLIANKNREKTGEVAVGKRVETTTAYAGVPVEKERVVIERTTPTDAGRVAAEGEAFQEGEVARIEVYEEKADIHKEAFVREEVSVRKEVDRETATASDEVRREVLDVNTEGNPVVEHNR